jgi:hypothetical protein
MTPSADREGRKPARTPTARAARAKTSWRRCRSWTRSIPRSHRLTVSSSSGYASGCVPRMPERACRRRWSTETFSTRPITCS